MNDMSACENFAKHWLKFRRLRDLTLFLYWGLSGFAFICVSRLLTGSTRVDSPIAYVLVAFWMGSVCVASVVFTKFFSKRLALVCSRRGQQLDRASVARSCECPKCGYRPIETVRDQQQVLGVF